jgi:two-component system, NarL family, sensor histidine kinase UhpB
MTAPTLRRPAGFSVHRRVLGASAEAGRQEIKAGAGGGSAAAATPAPTATKRHSLLWRLSLIDLSVLAVIVLLLTLTPITLHAPPKEAEVAVLLAGFAVIAAANLWLLRRAVTPLHQLSQVMESIDPMDPGTRVRAEQMRDAELVALAESFNAMLDRLELERRQSALRALSAQEGERVRVARELHDEIGQTLTAIAIDAERNAAIRQGSERQAWERAAQLAQESVDDLRRIARRLRPEALDDLGLVNALIALCNRISEHGGIPIARRLPEALPDHPPAVDLVLYRVAQEALTNVIRHARATRAELELEADDERLRLLVRDNGRGLRLDELPAGSNGIIGMRERALLVGGTLSLRSSAGAGTEVELEIPLAAR